MVIDEIIDVIKAIISADFKVNNNYSFWLGEIVYKLNQEGYYSEEWAELCASLYDKKWLSEYPEILREYYFEHPLLLCEIILNPKEKDYYRFGHEYVLPESAYSDLYALTLFVAGYWNRRNRLSAKLPFSVTAGIDPGVANL